MLHADDPVRGVCRPAAGAPADDCPLVAHFSGNDPQTLLDAARQAERCRGVVAVDLNLGCPQRAARSGRFDRRASLEKQLDALEVALLAP